MLRVIEEPGRITAEDGESMATVRCTDEWAGELICNGDPKCLLAVLRRVFARDGLLFVIEDSNEHKEQLERIYRKMGGTYLGKIFRT